MHGIDREGRFGFFSVADWLGSVWDSFPAPWALAPRKGKYYGTVITDARRVPILSVWESVGQTSARELEYYGSTLEEWEPCDTHWESELAVNLALSIIALRQDRSQDRSDDLT